MKTALLFIAMVLSAQDRTVPQRSDAKFLRESLAKSNASYDRLYALTKTTIKAAEDLKSMLTEASAVIAAQKLIIERQSAIIAAHEKAACK